MIEAAIVTAIRRRLTAALAPPRERLRPLRIEGHAVGWLDGQRALRLRAFADAFDVRDNEIAMAPQLADFATRTAAFDRVTRILAAEGALTAWREERYAVAREFGAPPWFLLERAAARYFGIHTYAAHVNGVVENAGVRMWLARRSPTKAIDPGMLDNLVGGGIAAGQSVTATVVKEALEEAGIDAALARRARSAATIDICRAQPDGLQRETIFVHDLSLPAEFMPACIDGEAVEHRLVGLSDAAQIVANAEGPDVATADSSLVILDYLLRHDEIPRNGPEYAALDALRHPSCAPFV
jgi:8-oxo-dGTP pyrophosphatase MutT (NUDIX family)